MAKESLAKVTRERDSLKTRWSNARKRQASTQGDVMQTGGVALGAFGAGYWRGKHPNPEDSKILGLDGSLVLGAAAAAAALSGAAGSMTSFLLGVGQGAIADYASQKGVEHGIEARNGA